MTAAEERALRELVCQAWSLRETPYLADACAAIVDWFERRPLMDLERRQRREAELLALLREGRAAA